jgi:hypothetical protein
MVLVMIEYLFSVGESFVTYSFYPIFIPRRYYKQLVEEIYDGKGENNINIQVTSPNDLYDLLIHEICHIRVKEHRQDWQDAMLEKDSIAERLGQEALAAWIRRDADDSSVIEQYEEHRLKVRICGWVSECMKKQKSISFEDMMSIKVTEYNVPKVMKKKYLQTFREKYDYYKSEQSEAFLKRV